MASPAVPCAHLSVCPTCRVAGYAAPPPAACRADGARRLTPRLLDVLEALGRGETRVETAARLHIAPSTVKTHIYHLFKALGVHTASRAVAVGFRTGLIE